MKKICVIGLGYIGLPTASMFAANGVDVLGVDINEKVVKDLQDCKLNIYEPGLQELVNIAIKNNHLKVSLNPSEADVYIISVPTPFKENHEPDLKYIESAVKEIAPYVQGGNLIILESTSPVGTTRKIAALLCNYRKDLYVELTDDGKCNQNNRQEVYLAYCPERVLPGKIIEELKYNNRIIGGINKKSSKLAKEVYEIFVEGEIFITNDKTAEMAKLTENSYRDLNIAFANELSLICDKAGINVWELIKLANKHPRVNILQPGPGVGGHCIAVDPWFIVDGFPEEAKLIKMARDVNDNKPKYVVHKVSRILDNNKIFDVAVLGLSFKADIDDLRESPAIEVLFELASKYPNVNFNVVEPFVSRLPEKISNYHNITLETVENAIDHSVLVIILVDHTIFKHMDQKMFINKIVIDTRGIYEK